MSGNKGPFDSLWMRGAFIGTVMFILGIAIGLPTGYWFMTQVWIVISWLWLKMGPAAFISICCVIPTLLLCILGVYAINVDTMTVTQ